ncbi:unnamed protein product [Rotaria socialis]|uniref:G-protein coupled receptors family 1 profile domain-containing protein n=2 Tax=Rotaria socialis TaxID=392032 RepID=A0A817LBD2_9BILA|nr:unnamed protein product [Rotaria socialis]
MFGLVHCNASILARQNTDPNLYFVRTLMRNWLWPIITFFGITGNILAVTVLTKRRMIQSSTNNYLVALALVDTAYLILTLIINTLQNPCFTDTSLSEIFLTICRPIADFSSNASVWLTVTFTVERWVAITYPLQSRRWCTINLARRIICGVLLASLICTLPSAFEVKLVRIVERKNVSNTSICTSYIKAEPTVLGSSLLYHQIYFNFVTFAIIWIPLLLLLIFNTILIVSVRRSKQHDRQNCDGDQLRRHSRTNHTEQRKITIMLIAVVIVFTVCQIPQAISLTVQSFFPVFAQTPKVLIYNNFANCCVAINASINFLLYCFFSSRFRSICRENFKCLNKYCAYFIDPKTTFKRKVDQRTYFNSFDNNSWLNQSYNSLSGNHLQTRVSGCSIDINPRYLHQIIRKQSQITNDEAQSWFSCLPSKYKRSKNSNRFQLNRFSQSTVETV